MKILYLEDDIALGLTIEEFLEDHNFDVTLVRDGDAALDKLYEKNYDLLLLDVQVPNINGFELLKNLRESNIQTPAIFTTSLNSIEDLSYGYEIGADDYLKKPFELKELLFRIKAILKREYKLDENTLKLDDEITFNIQDHKLKVLQTEYTLNQKESELLKLLFQYKKSCVSFDMIFDCVWSSQEMNSYESLRTYVKNLRKYIGKDKIKNIKKQGYMLV